MVIQLFEHYDWSSSIPRPPPKAKIVSTYIYSRLRPNVTILSETMAELYWFGSMEEAFKSAGLATHIMMVHRLRLIRM